MGIPSITFGLLWQSSIYAEISFMYFVCFWEGFRPGTHYLRIVLNVFLENFLNEGGEEKEEVRHMKE